VSLYLCGCGEPDADVLQPAVDPSHGAAIADAMTLSPGASSAAPDAARGKPAQSDPSPTVPPGRSDDASAPGVLQPSDAGSANGDAGVSSGEAGPANGAADTGAPIGSGAGACLDGITDYQKNGPFKYSAKSAGAIKYWVPSVPAGCKVPVVHLANGTGATCANYQQVLNQLASHGFLAACYEDANTGNGSQGLKAFETALSMFPELADNRLGSTGHSQGGQAAFTVLQLAEQKFGDEMIYAGLAMQPASGFGEQPSGGSWQQVYAKIKSPMFMFSGTADVLVSESWVQQAFTALSDSIEAYWWSGVGATHIPTPQEHQQLVQISWFRWKLLGDGKACEFFKKLPDGDKWDKRKTQNEKACQ
jgi:predicted alpha/beta-hydrolase family hydrolase